MKLPKASTTVFSFFIILAAFLPLSAQSHSFLALGDSYTIGQGVDTQLRWPTLLAKRLETSGFDIEPPHIIARTGWTTGNLIAAIARDKVAQAQSWDLVSLLIGVNNQFQGRSREEYALQFGELLAAAVRLAGGNKDRVFVVSIPDYGFTPYGQSRRAFISAEIDAFNSIGRQITESEGIRWCDITALSREGLAAPTLVADDGLHPSGQQYAAWAARIEKAVARMLRN